MRIDGPESRQPVVEPPEPPKPAPRPVEARSVRTGYSDASGFEDPRPSTLTNLGAVADTPRASLDPANSDVVGRLSEQERAKYDALPPDQRAAYNTLSRDADKQGWRASHETRQLLRNDQVDDYLAVQRSLGAGERGARVQQMLFDGRLNDRSRGTDGNALSYLAPLAQGGTTATGIDRTELLGQLVDDLADPTSMTQGEGNRDCGAYAIAASTASRHPAAYARIATELAETGKSEVHLRGETRTLTFEGATEAADARRSVTQRIVAEALGESVDDSAQHQGFFANITEKLQVAVDEANGMDAQEVAERNAEASGGAETYSTQYVPSLEEAGGDASVRERARADAEQQLREQLSAGQQPLVLLNPEDGKGMGHWVVVTGIEQDGKVRFLDGSGRAQQLPLEAFMGRTDSVVYDEARGHAAPSEFQNHGWGNRGGDRGVKTDPPDGG